MATTPLAAQTGAGEQPHIRGLWWKLSTGLWMSLAILAAFLYIGPAEGFTMGGHGAKVIFFHVPCAWLATLAYVVAAWFATQYLSFLRGGVDTPRQDRRSVARAGLALFVLFAAAAFPARANSPVMGTLIFLALAALLVALWLYFPPNALADLKCASAMELGLLFSILATVSGSIFSHNEWQAYWSWDPRQTSIVIIMLIFAAYLVLRGAMTDPNTRARLCSVYALVAAIPGIFLIWVLPRIVQTLHQGPNQAVVGGGLSPNFRIVLYGLALPAFLALFTWLFQLRVRLMKLEAHRETV